MIVIGLFILMLALVIYMIPVLGIYEHLKKYNDKTGFLAMQLHLREHLKQYRKITKIKNGKQGPFYVLWFGGVVLASILIVMSILFFILNGI